MNQRTAFFHRSLQPSQTEKPEPWVRPQPCLRRRALKSSLFAVENANPQSGKNTDINSSYPSGPRHTCDGTSLAFFLGRGVPQP
jgi:hypothetical protein